jgi:DNA polymerase
MSGKPRLHLDYETRSACDLPKAGAYRYAEDPSTDVWCCCYALDDGPVETWLPGQPRPPVVQEQIGRRGLFVAHNYTFERSVSRAIMTPRYGWPEIPLELWDCTALRAAALALPRALGKVAQIMRLEERKDAAGARLMKAMMRPLNDAEPWEWHRPPGALERLVEYCKQDVVVEREIDRLVRPLTAAERGMMMLDCVINERGFKVDLEAIDAALHILEVAEDWLDTELRMVTDGQVKKVTDIAGLARWLRARGAQVGKSLDKEAVDKLLAGVLNDDARRALEIRKEAAYTSTKKLLAMRAAAGRDGRVRGSMMFLGAASTGRFSGSLVQPQNLPRGSGLVPWVNPRTGRPDGLVREAAEAFPAILTGDADTVSFVLGPPHRAISDCIRGFITAGEGKVLVSCDYSAIEAKIIAVEAGQTNAIDVFLNGDDIYKFSAAQIYNIPLIRVNKQERQVGKCAQLALGFQGGVGAFTNMAKIYRVNMADAYESVLAVTSQDVIDKTNATYDEASKAGDIPIGMPIEAFKASDMVKRNWRLRNTNIVSYWYNCEAAAMAAVLEAGSFHRVRNVTYLCRGPYLYCQLASGRTIVYPEPRVEVVKTRWGTRKAAMTYIGPDRKNTSFWTRRPAYGGLLVENIVQATAASVLRDGLRNLEAAGYPVVLHVHDEAVVETEPERADTERIEALMTMMSPWMVEAGWPKGLITAKADGPMERFRKD